MPIIQQGTHERTAEAVKLWRLVFGEERGLLHLTAVRTPQGSKRWLPETKKELNLTYPANERAAAEWAIARCDEGHNVYFCAHLLTTAKPREGGGSGRVKENASALASLYADLDGAKLPEGTLRRRASWSPRRAVFIRTGC